MARLNTRSASTDASSSSFSRRTREETSTTPPSSPVASGSDKENYTSGSSRRTAKRKSTDMSSTIPEPASQKRRRVEGRRQSQNTQSLRRKVVEGELDKKYYDPDQDPEERRRTKKDIRDLYTTLNDSRAEYLQTDSRGLVETLTQADRLYRNVKQTSDATVDSRLLVAAADLSYKKVKTMTLGDSTVGVDVDDFVSKCIAFMKRGDRDAGEETQNPERRRRQVDEDDEESGDTMNWGYLGRNACFLYNSRPCLSGFLLGPLSVQKKVRQQTQRRAKYAPSQLLKPIQLSEENLDKQESANLSQICKEISSLLRRTRDERMRRAEEEASELPEDAPGEETNKILRKVGVTSDAGIPLFEFCVNPLSFGQTVENMFYVSFLVKESSAGLDYDDDGLPSLHPTEQRSVAERLATPRNQAVFTLSFDVWEDIVKTFGIKESIIPHRQEEEKYEDGVLDVDSERDAEPQVHGGAEAGPTEADEDSDMYG